MPLTLDRPPKTILEVYRMLPEGTRAELIRGRIFMSPTPLLMEVLSPGTAKSDLTKKKPIYEKEGFKEYWLVDPKTKLATGFQLVKGKFHELKKEKGKLSSNLLKQVFKF